MSKEDVPFRAMLAYKTFQKSGRIPDVEFMDTYQFQKTPTYEAKPNTVADITVNTPQLKDDILSSRATRYMTNAAADREARSWMKDEIPETVELTPVSPDPFDKTEVVAGNDVVDSIDYPVDDDELPKGYVAAYNAIDRLVRRYGIEPVRQAMIMTKDARNNDDSIGPNKSWVDSNAEQIRNLIEYDRKRTPKERTGPRITKY
jgi:hypothetical protein